MAEKELYGGGRNQVQERDGEADTSKHENMMKEQPHNLKGRMLPAEQRITKKDTDDPFLGQPESFSHQFLPSIGDVLNHVRAKQMKDQQRGEDRKFSKTVYEANRETAEDVIKIWGKGPFPHISSKGIEKKILKFQESHKGIMKNRNKPSQNYRTKEDEAKTEYKNLFDISKKDWKNKIQKDRKDEAKAAEDIEYLERCMVGAEVGPFGGGDMKYTAMIARRMKRKREIPLEKSTEVCLTKVVPIMEDTEFQDVSDDDSEFKPALKKPDVSKKP